MGQNGYIGKPAPKTVELSGAIDPSGNSEALLVDSGGNLKVSGTFTSTSAANGTNGATAPTVSTQVAGQNPSGNLTPLQVDSSGNLLTSPAPGAATSALQVTGNAALGSILLDLTNGTQITQITGTVPLPTGSATAANQVTGNNSLASIDGKTPALGQALAAASVPVVLTAAQITTLTPLTSVTVTQATGTNLHTVIDSGTISLPTGASTSALQTTGNTSLASIDAGIPAALGSTTSANSMPVVIASDQAAIPTSAPASSTSTLTSVAAAASSTSLLALNTSRKQATFFNDSTAILYLKLGTTASTTSYTVQIPSNGYYELPGISVYTGAIQGIWSSATGNVRITELT